MSTEYKKPPHISFRQFLEKFPEVALPVTLSEETAHVFSRENDPLPGLMVQQFILTPEEQNAPDDMTEFVPCFRIPQTHTFHAVVYWKGALMDHQFVMLTFTEDGRPIDRRVLAGLYSDGKEIVQSIAHLEEDWTIYIVTGKQKATDRFGAQASKNTAREFELLPEGQIIENFLMNEDQ